MQDGVTKCNETIIKKHDLLTASCNLYLNPWFELFASVLTMLLRKSNPLECLVGCIDIWIYLYPKTQQIDSLRDFWQTSGITCYFQIKQILTIALMRREKYFQHNRKFGCIVTIDARRFLFFFFFFY